MKIFFPIGAFYPSQIGGPCNTVYWHCFALKQNNVEPTIITSNIGIKENKIVFNEWIKSDCGNVYYSKKGIFSYSTLKKISKEISHADLLHLNSLFSPFSIYSFIYRSLFHPNKKIVWSVRGELNNNALKFSNWKKRPLLYIYKLFNNRIIFHSTSIQETKGIRNIFPHNKVFELPNLLTPHKRLNMPTNNNLLYVGRIHPIKSLHKLIKSLSLSKVFLNSSSKLLIVGKQENRHNKYKFELEALINTLGLQKKVIFKGHIEGEEKEKLYSSSYVLILPSETENFGNVVVESLNQGTPVIASKGTPWKILEEFDAGLHITNEPKELAKAIDSILLLDKVTYQRMQSNCYKLVDQNFKIDLQIQKWINLYKNILYEN